MYRRPLSFIALLLLLPATSASAKTDGDAARQWFRLGMKALESGSPLEAADAFERATQQAPDWGLAYLQWGTAVLLYQPEAPDALPALQQAVALAPRNPRAHFALGQAYLRGGQPADAIGALDHCLKLRDDYPGARFLLARTLHEQEAPRARAEMERVLRGEPTHTGALTVLAEIYESAGRSEEAEEMLLRIAYLQPSVAHHFVRLASFYDRAGERKKAKRARKRANVVDRPAQRKMRPLRK